MILGYEVYQLLVGSIPRMPGVWSFFVGGCSHRGIWCGDGSDISKRWVATGSHESSPSLRTDHARHQSDDCYDRWRHHGLDHNCPKSIDTDRHTCDEI